MYKGGFCNIIIQDKVIPVQRQVILYLIIILLFQEYGCVDGRPSETGGIFSNCFQSLNKNDNKHVVYPNSIHDDTLKQLPGRLVGRYTRNSVPNTQSIQDLIYRRTNVQLSTVSIISTIHRGGGGGITTPTRINPPKIAKDTFRGSTSSIPTQQESQQQQLTTISDRDKTKDIVDAFLTRDSRNTFISRVYGILTGQLIVTAITVILFGLYPSLTAWMKRPGWGTIVPILSLGLTTIAWVIINVSPEARRKSPTKWQVLAMFTIGEAISVGFMSSFYEFRSVVISLLATAIASITVSVYTIKQKNPNYDLSQWGSTLSSLGTIFMVYGFFSLLQITHVLPKWLYIPYNDALYGIAGAALFSGYLAYHTKLIVAGKHSKYQMNEKDYIFGAMALYNDVISTFIYILKVLGKEKDEH